MEPGSSLSRDDIFFLLSSRRRRFVLRYLWRTGRAVDRSALVDALAAWENGVDAEELSDGQRRTVDVSLYQTHLEELGDAGVVTYDAETGRVEPTDRIEELAGYLDRWKEVGPDGVDDLGPRNAGGGDGERRDGSARAVVGSGRAADGEAGPAEAGDGADRSTGAAAPAADVGTRVLRPVHYLGLAVASLALYVAVIVDSGAIWRVPLFVAALVVISLVAVHAYPLYSLRKRGPFRTK